MSVGHATELTKISKKYPPPVHAFGATSRGRQRPNNEDALFCSSRRGVYLVCDGVGGEKRGEIASRAAVQTAGSLLGKKRNIPLAVSDANAEIITNGQGAATTIVGAVETSQITLTFSISAIAAPIVSIGKRVKWTYSPATMLRYKPVENCYQSLGSQRFGSLSNKYFSSGR